MKQLKNGQLVVILNCLAKYFEDGIMPRVLESIETGETFEEKRQEWRWIGNGNEPVGVARSISQLSRQNWEVSEVVVDNVPMAKLIMDEFVDFIQEQVGYLSIVEIDLGE